jgi:hypothetical protein
MLESQSISTCFTFFKRSIVNIECLWINIKTVIGSLAFRITKKPINFLIEGIHFYSQISFSWTHGGQKVFLSRYQMAKGIEIEMYEEKLSYFDNHGIQYINV